MADNKQPWKPILLAFSSVACGAALLVSGSTGMVCSSGEVDDNFASTQSMQPPCSGTDMHVGGDDDANLSKNEKLPVKEGTSTVRIGSTYSSRGPDQPRSTTVHTTAETSAGHTITKTDQTKATSPTSRTTTTPKPPTSATSEDDPYVRYSNSEENAATANLSKKPKGHVIFGKDVQL